MQEIVYLSNSFCKKDFPNNQAGNFQNKLNKSLTFKTKGKVALSEILYTPGSWDNVRLGNNTIGIKFLIIQFLIRIMILRNYMWTR